MKSSNGTARKQQDIQVILTINSGVGELLFKPLGVEVTLYDYDVEGSDSKSPGLVRDPDGRRCFITKWSPSQSVLDNGNWPEIKRAANGAYSRSWLCNKCNRRIELTYEELAEAGVPICADCDSEMEIQ